MTTDISRAASEHINGSADARLASVAIVVPAYNEEANLPNLFRELEAATAGGEHRYRIILVDDGSVDATAQIAESYRGPLDIEIVSQGVNKGLGAAILAGFRRALAGPGPRRGRHDRGRHHQRPQHPRPHGRRSSPTARPTWPRARCTTPTG